MRLLYTLRDQDWATTKSLGILHVSLGILEGLLQEPAITSINVLANRSLAARLPPLPAHARFHCLQESAPRGWARLRWDHWQLAAWANRLRPDWLLLPKGFSPLGRWPRCAVSAYAHDNIFAHHSASPPMEQALFARALRRTARRADLVVTNSRFTAAEISSLAPYRPSPQAIGAPVSPWFQAATNRAAPAEEPTRILLLTSRFPHKLTAQAIAWLERWREERSRGLAVTGIGSLPDGLTWPDHPGWIHHPRLAVDVFAREAQRCALLVYFSAYEGFGLPPAEALASGLSAVASDLPSHREHLPSDLLFANDDFASFCKTAEQALNAPNPPQLSWDEGRDVAQRWVAALRSARPGSA